MSATPPLHPDHQYIVGLLQHDSACIAKIYANHFDKIKGMVSKNSGTADDAMDIFQEALIAIYEQARDRQFQLHCPLDAFLFTICRNKWFNELRKRNHIKVTNEVDSGYEAIPEVEDQVNEMEITLKKEALLAEKYNELGSGCKELLSVAQQVKDMQLVAEKLKMTYGYVRKKKSECMAKLIELVKNDVAYLQLKKEL